MDVSAQKQGVPGISGRLEHTSVTSQLIKVAKANRGDLAVVWLDHADAYGGDSIREVTCTGSLPQCIVGISGTL